MRARLLDLTRSLRRAGQIATGIDRVERAYLRQFLADDVPVFALCRTAFGYVLLDRAGINGFLQRIEGQAQWGRANMMSRLVWGRKCTTDKAESTVRHLACARSIPARLPKMLGAQLGGAYDYFNVGHSNLTSRVLSAVKDTGGSVHALVHDVIPLEFPQFQRPGTVEPFREQLVRVSRMADRIIYNSNDTRLRTETVLGKMGRVPPAVVAHLGIDPAAPDQTLLPENLKPNFPYFVTVGTIEPRKNHAFLLDLWEQLGADAPQLFICGNRGWNNDDVFRRLDRLPPDSAIREVQGLDDGALAALVQGAAGGLFPTFAEGFGLPLVEAQALGVRVLCNELPVLREVLSTNTSFTSVFRPEMWLNTIREWKECASLGNAAETDFEGPGWQDHFKTVLRLR